MKHRLFGFAVLLPLISPFGCLSGADLGNLADGASAANESTLGTASGIDLVTGALGNNSSTDVSKGDLLATMIDFFAASSDPTDSEALMWEVAASAARDGRAGVKRAVADFVIGQMTKNLSSATMPATP
jgi:hypothetical protein